MPASRRKSKGPLLPLATTGQAQEPVVAVQVTDHVQQRTLVGLRVQGQHGYVYVPEGELPKGKNSR